MTVSTALQQALERVKSINSGVLVFTHPDTGTSYSAVVYKSFARSYNREMQNAQYNEFDDMSVMAATDDVSSWGLVPNQSQVTLDGVVYELGQSITKTADYWTIFLRLAK